MTSDNEKRKYFDSYFGALRNVKKDKEKPHAFTAKTKSKNNIVVQYHDTIFNVWDNGVHVIKKPLSSLDIGEVLQYIQYKINN
jgi:hypothetical protein